MKRHRVVMSSSASDDVANLLGLALSTSTLEVAQALDRLVDAALRSLETLGQRGRTVPELRRRGITTYRELIRRPYRIIYRMASDEVWVLAVVDGRRDLEELLYERVRR